MKAFNNIDVNINEVSESTISKNICNLDFYLNGCSANEEIKSSELFNLFISQNEDSKSKPKTTNLHL